MRQLACVFILWSSLFCNVINADALLNAPKVKKLEQFSVVGPQAETSYFKEIMPFGSKTAKLWERFTKEDVLNTTPNVVKEAGAYAVYSDYETDDKGRYTVTIGGKVTSIKAPATMKVVTIPAGQYMIFEASAKSVDSIINAWKAILKHFERDPSYQRTYVVDFEHYKSPELVDIYVSVKAS